MTNTSDYIQFPGCADKAFAYPYSVKLNEEGRTALAAMQTAFDLAATHIGAGVQARQADRENKSIDVSSGTLYAMSLVIKAHEEGVKAASLRAYLDFFDMLVKPEVLAGKSQINRNIMLSAAHALKNI